MNRGRNAANATQTGALYLHCLMPYFSSPGKYHHMFHFHYPPDEIASLPTHTVAKSKTGRPLSRGPLNVTHFLAVQPRAEIPFSFVGLGSGRWVPWRKLTGQFHPLHLSALRWLNCPPWFSQLQGPIPGVAILSPNDPCPQHFQGTQKIEVNL